MLCHGVNYKRMLRCEPVSEEDAKNAYGQLICLQKPHVCLAGSGPVFNVYLKSLDRS